MNRLAKYRANGLNGPRAMARRARQQCRIETRDLRRRVAELDLAIRNGMYWGAGLTARNEERTGLLQNIATIEARYAV